MTSFETPIQRVRVEAFRGFRDRQEFDLSASAVIITGPNGTGKTSFFDALQWCLVGSIERIESLRARRSVEHIVSQYRLGRKAVVEVDLTLASGAVTLRRSGDHTGSSLEVRRSGYETAFGSEAEAVLRDLLLPDTDLTLESALKTSGLMQQDVMRGVLEARGADRYQHISTVLGLSRLEEFEEATRYVAREASDREAKAREDRDRFSHALIQARERLAVAQSRLESRPQIAAMREELRLFLESTPPSMVIAPENIDLETQNDTRALATEFATAIDEAERIEGLSQRARSLRSGLEDEPNESDLAAVRSAVDAAERSLMELRTEIASSEAQLTAARSAANELAQLAAFAIPLLSTECPVCGQSISREHVEAELRSRAARTDTILALQDILATQRNAVKSSEDSAATWRAQLRAAELQVARWDQYRSTVAEADDHLSRLRSGQLRVRTTAETLEEFAHASAPSLDYLRTRRRRLLEFLNAFDQQVDAGGVERAAAEAKNLESTLAASEALLEEESVRSRRIQSLAEQTISARVEVTERRVRAMQPLVANIFQRLDPHPAFKTIEFELDTYYRRGTTSPIVRDIVEDISADPLVVFSTSQANIVALSYFIAMSLSAGQRGLPFLLLDDPVQSMDDVNVLGFADLCRHLQSRRQLIISTHEKRFAGLLERKLAPRTTEASAKVIRFAGWDRSGPTTDQRSIDPQLVGDPIRVVGLAG